jgi:cytochrome c oxidase assembly protein subunit 15
VLSGGLVVGLVAEVVMGYFVVKYQLAPALVSVHFLLGLVFLAVAVVLHHRARQPERPARKELVVAPVPATLARATLVALAVVATLGTIVTSTGPHGGSPSARRFGFALHDVARIHAGAADLFVGLTGLLLWTLIRSGAPRSVMRRAQVMLLTVLAQGAVGYTQYFIGDPVGLVAVHVAGASLLVLATLRFYFGLWVSTPAGADSLMLDDAVLVP